ncbi:hypothetical protein D3C80_1422930 [compost metagenome]
MKARSGFQRLQQLRRQRTGVEQHLRIDSGYRTEHQVTDIVPRSIARAQAGRQQQFDQPGLFVADAANLQVAAVGGLDLAGGKPFGSASDRVSLVCRERTAGQLDPADPTVFGLDDAQQPRTGRGAQRSVGLVGRYRLVQKVTRQS